MTISECAFADDLAILTKSEEDMKHNLKVWKEELNKHNMTINTEKTKLMVIARQDILTDITINGKEIEQVETFTYLGITLHNKRSLEDEINSRILATNRSYLMLNKLILNNKQITKRTKMIIYKTIYTPTLIYGSESKIKK